MERVTPSNIRALRGPQGERGPRGPQGERGGVAIVAASEPEPDELGSMWYNPFEPGTPPGGGSSVVISDSEPIAPDVGGMWVDTSV